MSERSVGEECGVQRPGWGLFFLLNGAAFLLGAAWMFWVVGDPGDPSGPPRAPMDPRFVGIGRDYLAGLGRAYSDAWEEGARALDAGQPLSSAMAAVGKEWDDGRAQLFDRVATPAFNQIVPESQCDADMTPRRRAAMAAAWRGFAKGLDSDP